MSLDRSSISEAAQSGPLYPYFHLAGSIPVADAVRELGGLKASIPKSLLASKMKQQEKSAAFGQRIISAKCFGLIEGRTEFCLTDLARRYYYPTSDQLKQTALLDILASPPAFNAIIRRFDGQELPSTEIIGNILHAHHGVPESWKDRVATYFMRSAEFAGALDGTFLRVNAGRHQAKIAAPLLGDPIPAAQAIEPQPTSATMRREVFNTGNTIWEFPYKGQYIRLETPEEMPIELWQKLSAYVEILKPPENQ